MYNEDKPYLPQGIDFIKGALHAVLGLHFEACKQAFVVHSIMKSL